jgi:hypothetical protein
VGQGIKRSQPGIIVDPLQDHDISPGRRDYRNRGVNLRVVATQQVAQQQSRAITAEVGVKGGEAQRIGEAGPDAQQRR